jgi:hypothetical protein
MKHAANADFLCDLNGFIRIHNECAAEVTLQAWTSISWMQRILLWPLGASDQALFVLAQTEPAARS